jgi:hypothetical protein
MVIAIVGVFDDMFDSYGTAEECELLTICVERFVPTCVYILIKSLHVQGMSQTIKHHKGYIFGM